MIWDWGFTWKSVTFTNCFVAIDCSAMGQGPDTQGTGSITLLDSSLVAVPFAIPVNPNFIPNFVMDNVQIKNVDFLVFEPGSTNYLEGQTGPITIQSWAMGKRYTSMDGEGGSIIGFVSPVPNKSPLLLDVNGKFFERGKPQYENFGVASFLSPRTSASATTGQVTSPRPSTPFSQAMSDASSSFQREFTALNPPCSSPWAQS